MILLIGASLRSLRAGYSLCIFPEGTRTRDGKVREFKRGYLRLAAEAGVPVLPVALSNGYRLWPPGRPLPRRAKMHVTIHSPRSISTRLSAAELRRLNDEIRSACLTAEP